MPVYEMACERCGERLQLVRPMREAPLTCPCPKCRADMARDLKAEMGQVHGDIQPYASEAMGCWRKEDRLVGEDYTADNRLIVKSRRHKHDLMRRTGMVEY